MPRGARANLSRQPAQAKKSVIITRRSPFDLANTTWASLSDEKFASHHSPVVAHTIVRILEHVLNVSRQMEECRIASTRYDTMWVMISVGNRRFLQVNEHGRDLILGPLRRGLVDGLGKRTCRELTWRLDKR